VVAFNKWNNYWLQLARTTETKPIYFFRFEDVMTNPKEELENLMKFILGLESLEGTVIEQRIMDVLSLGKDAT